MLIRPDGALAGFAEHPTTVTDVLAGVDAAVRAVVAAAPNARDPQLLACLCAGGGLRLAVVGTDRLTGGGGGAPGRAVGGRSRGARARRAAGRPGRRAGAARQPARRRAADQGVRTGREPGALLHNAARLGRARVRFPIVLAGNDAARDDALALLAATGRTVVACANVAPRPGELPARQARAAVAELYAQHVLGGRGPAAAPRFRRLVRVGTPDAVSSGAALLAAMLGVRVLVVDIGCATTDVHLAVPEYTGRAAVLGVARWAIAAPVRRRRAIWACARPAVGVLVEGQAEGVVDPVEADLLGPTVERMATEVGYVPRDAGSWRGEDRRIAALAAVLAVRRHRVALEASGRDLGDIGLLVLTGGVFRRPDASGLAAVVATVRNDIVLETLLAKARVAVDAELAVHAGGPPRGGGARRTPPARCCATTCSAEPGQAVQGVGRAPGRRGAAVGCCPGHAPGVGRGTGPRRAGPRDGVRAVADAAPSRRRRRRSRRS